MCRLDTQATRVNIHPARWFDFPIPLISFLLFIKTANAVDIIKTTT